MLALTNLGVYLVVSDFVVPLQCKQQQVSPGGGIGRRARFRCECFATCRFESCLGHDDSFEGDLIKLETFCASGGIGRHATLRG